MSCAVMHRGPYTVADWESLDETTDGSRIELLGGVFEINPPPGFTHQRLSDCLHRVLHDGLVTCGEDRFVAVSAIGVALTADTAVIPDLVVVRSLPDGATRADAADVLLAVEIVSPGSRRTDRMVKPTAYAEGGVPNFWRVEPVPGEPPTIVCFELVDGEYVKQATVTEDAPQHVRVGDITVDLDPKALYRAAFPR